MASRILPQEIVDVVLNHVGEDKRVLLATTLTARSFVRTSQMLLFEDVFLDRPKQVNSLVIALAKAPHLSSLVKRLSVSGGILLPYLGPSREPPHDTASKAQRQFDLAVLIDRLKCLEYFRLSPAPPPLTAFQRSWNDIDPPLLPSIEALIRRPNLQHLSLSRFEQVPIDLLDVGKMGHMSTLELTHVNFDRHQGLNEQSVPLIIKSNSISFDLDPLRRIFGGSTENSLRPLQSAQIILNAAGRDLRKLNLKVYEDRGLPSMSLTFGESLSSLIHLTSINLSGSCGKLWNGMDRVLFVFSTYLSAIPDTAPLSEFNLELSGYLKQPDHLSVSGFLPSIDNCLYERAASGRALSVSITMTAPEWSDPEDPRISELEDRVHHAMSWMSTMGFLRVTVFCKTIT